MKKGVAFRCWLVCISCCLLGNFTAAAKDGKSGNGRGGHHSPPYRESILLLWNDLALEAIRETHPGPPVVARMLAILHTATYDAWAAYDADALPTEPNAPARRPEAERTLVNKEIAVSFAAYRALVDLFPSEKPVFDIVMAELGYDINDLSVDPVSPVGIGNAAAFEVLSFRHHDGSNQLGDLGGAAYADYTGYAPINTPDSIVDPNRWQPLRVSDGAGGFVIQKFITPHWGLVVPFALTSGDQFRPIPPQPFGSKAYRKQADEVLKYSAELTDREKVIAEFWADGPSSELPPGHWNLFAHYVSIRDRHSLDEDVKMFFALTNAIFDASIVSWEAKRFYDYVRPVTAIHHLYAGKKVRAWAGPYQGTKKIRGEDWQPYQASTVVTPPFAEYVSGHSIFSAAGAEVLRQFTGSDQFGLSQSFEPGTSRVEPGTVPKRRLTLSWKTFSIAADEAGISRRYGGIHFVEGDVRGREAGKLIGAQAWFKAQLYFNSNHQTTGHGGHNHGGHDHGGHGHGGHDHGGHD